MEAAKSRVNVPMGQSFAVITAWSAYTTHRDPVLGLSTGYELPNAKDPEDTAWGTRIIDPRTGTSLPDDHLKIGSQFFYPLHYSLNLNWQSLGTWIVGFAALMMLVGLVSSVVMREDLQQTAVASVNTFLTGLHLQHFRHWLLRWLYVLGGLAGCACIATGFIFFVEKRKRQHSKQGVTGARWVDAFAVSTVTGIVIAALTMLIGNRLLPTDLAGLRLGTGYLQGRLRTGLCTRHLSHRAGGQRMHGTGLGRALPGHRRTGRVCRAAELGDHRRPPAAHHRQRLLARGGCDLAVLASAAIAVLAARKLKRRAQGKLNAPSADNTSQSEGAAASLKTARA